jgi:membrane fusion protein (multidrug efflux system)
MSAEEVAGARRPYTVNGPPNFARKPRSNADLQEIRDKLNNAQRVFDDYRAARTVKQQDAEFAWAKLVQEAALALPQLPAGFTSDLFSRQGAAIPRATADAPSTAIVPGPPAAPPATPGRSGPRFAPPEMTVAAGTTMVSIHVDAAAARAAARVAARVSAPAATDAVRTPEDVLPGGLHGRPERRQLEQPRPSPRRRRALVLVGLMAVLASVSALGIARLRMHGTGSAEGTALAGTAFEGTIIPANQFTIAAPVTTIVQRVIVSVGERVTAGQPLLMADDREARAALDAAELDLRTAEGRVAGVRRRLGLLEQTPSADFARATGRLSNAQRNSEQVPTRQWRDSPERAEAAQELARLRIDRVQKLWEQGLVARQELDDAAIGLRVASNDLENARRAAQAVAILSTAQTEQSDLQWKLARAEQAQQRDLQTAELSTAMLRRDEAALQVKAATARLAAATIKASSPGVVTEMLAHAGDQVYGGAPLVRLAVLDPLLVEVQVAPALINALRPGQVAMVTLPGVPTEQTAGTIVAVNPIPNRNGNHTVQVRFENAAGQLLTGQPAEVRFQTP